MSLSHCSSVGSHNISTAAVVAYFSSEFHGLASELCSKGRFLVASAHYPLLSEIVESHSAPQALNSPKKTLALERLPSSATRKRARLDREARGFGSSYFIALTSDLQQATPTWGRNMCFRPACRIVL